MIKVPYLEDTGFLDWYCENVLKIIGEKRKRLLNNKSTRCIANIIKSLSDDDIREILCCPRELLEKHEWIREYLKLADFLAFSDEFKMQCKKGKYSRKKLIEKYIYAYDGKYLSSIHQETQRNNYNTIIDNARTKLNEINEIVETLFNYDFLDTSFRRNLFAKMDVKICPYCNQSYVHTLAEKKYLADLDHVYPKSLYALFSLSIWNLVPCCKSCNQSLKKNYVRTLLNPTQDGFGRYVIFKTFPQNIRAFRGESSDFDYEWTVKAYAPQEFAKKSENNIDLFRLNDVYANHRAKIKDILRKKYCFDKRYKEEYKRMLHINSDEELNFSIYGCSLNPRKFKDEILSKMTYDLVEDGLFFS